MAALSGLSALTLIRWACAVLLLTVAWQGSFQMEPAGCVLPGCCGEGWLEWAAQSPSDTVAKG